MVLNIRKYLRDMEDKLPHDLITIPREINPAAFEVTALLEHLERENLFPALLFEKPLNLKGEVAQFKLITNVFATRKRCAVALGLPPEKWKLELSLEYARREANPLKPVIISPSEAPVKEVIKTGISVDLREFPIVRHHEMDGGPYIDMTVVSKDPDEGFYNMAFLRNQYKGPTKLGIHMSPRHNWTIFRKNEEQGRPTPVAIVLCHHPAFFLGALNVAPFGTDDYSLTGGIMGEPLRLVPSETWGKEFLVPADAEIVIEGEILPFAREVEGPFGEFPGTYGPERVRPVIEVRAVTHRRDALYQDVFVGHRDNWILGGIPKEGSLYTAIRGVVPTVKGIHFAISGTCRFNCYISIDKKVEGETKQAALMAIAQCDFVKNVIVVDGDIDPFNEQEVMWAVATRMQPDCDIDIIRNIKANTLDPSLVHDIRGSKMVIDATMPVDRPFAKRLNIPEEALSRIKKDDFIPPEVLGKIFSERSALW